MVLIFHGVDIPWVSSAQVRHVTWSLKEWMVDISSYISPASNLLLLLPSPSSYSINLELYHLNIISLESLSHHILLPEQADQGVDRFIRPISPLADFQFSASTSNSLASNTNSNGHFDSISTAYTIDLGVFLLIFVQEQADQSLSFKPTLICRILSVPNSF